MARRRRDFDNEYFFHIRVDGWDVHTSFNDYAYMNFFDEEPFEERGYTILHGFVESTMSKKVKVGQRAKVILHPHDDWRIRDRENLDLKIGDTQMVSEGEKKSCGCCMRASLFLGEPASDSLVSGRKRRGACQASVGSDLFRSSGKVFNFSFDSKAVYLKRAKTCR